LRAISRANGTRWHAHIVRGKGTYLVEAQDRRVPAPLSLSLASFLPIYLRQPCGGKFDRLNCRRAVSNTDRSSRVLSLMRLRENRCNLESDLVSKSDSATAFSPLIRSLASILGRSSEKVDSELGKESNFAVRSNAIFFFFIVFRLKKIIISALMENELSFYKEAWQSIKF